MAGEGGKKLQSGSAVPIPSRCSQRAEGGGGGGGGGGVRLVWFWLTRVPAGEDEEVQLRGPSSLLYPHRMRNALPPSLQVREQRPAAAGRLLY